MKKTIKKVKFIEKIKENLKKLTKSDEKAIKSEKEYIENLIKKEKEENKKLSTQELSDKIGIDKETIEEVLKEPEKKAKEKKKIKKPKKKIKLKFAFIDKTDKETIKEIFFKIILFGIPINFSLFVIFNITFNLYSWLGWGFAFWFIKKEIVNIVRSMWIK